MSANRLNTYLRRFSVVALVMTAILFAPFKASALPASFYSQNSRLADGKWRKVKILKEGMQIISNAQLKSMGFTDPSKVNVYGYGGRQLSDRLNSSMPDDLPVQPVVRTENGIIFYAAGTIRWDEGNIRGMEFAHRQNYYSTDSYYYLSDSETIETAIPTIDGKNITDNVIDYFTETLLHEQEIEHPGNSGSLMYGEDFRTSTSRPFKFELTDAVDNTAKLLVAFATRTTNSGSSFSVTVNGKQFESTNADHLPAVSSTEMMARYTESIKNIEDAGSELNVNIKYNPGGVVQMARLDYIRVNYSRRLSVASGEIIFRTADTQKVSYMIHDADSSLKIWDVTDAASPVEISYRLDGNNAIFTPFATGYREYVAFRPSTVCRTTGQAVKVANQNLHSLPVPDMLIVSPDEYRNQALRLAAFHEEHDGFRVHVISPQQIYNEFSSGAPDVTAIRKILKMWHDRGADENHKLGYCIIMGRSSYDNREISEAVARNKYPRVPIWQAPDGLTAGNSFCTDDYFGFLEDNDRALDMGSAKLLIGVGRFPVKNAKEAETTIDKLIKYVESPDYGDWRNRVLVIADDQDNGIHLTQAESCMSALLSTDGGKEMTYDKLYLDSYPMEYGGTGSTYPQATQRLLKIYDEGVNFVDYIGHGNPSQWGHESLWTYDKIISMTNKRLPIFMTATCEFGRWDDNKISAAEILWLNPDAGAIALLTATRLAYITQNGYYNKLLSAEMFARDKDGGGRRFGDIILNSKNKFSGSDTNKLRYALIGDPAMRIPLPSLRVSVDEINGKNISSTDDDITLTARSRVKISGSVLNLDGSLAEDFNGILTPKLFDAERVITTLGNGEEGAVIDYNDRTNLLFTGNVAVTNGKWEVQFVIPIEIENNFSPAKLALYAYSQNGKEAHGSFEDFYIFGYNEEDLNDTEGPVISGLTLNSSAFREGDVVNPTPIVLASLFDESGINISQAGIGHQLTITVDDKIIHNNISDFFTTDIADNRGGKIAYQLSELEPGEHTMKLTAWDNSGNSSEASLKFKVSENAIPVLYDVLTDANPATTSVTFTLVHDSPGGEAVGKIEVFDLGGAKIWASDTPAGSSQTVTWNLTDGSGARVNRGIYLYRATVTTAEGTISTKTKKLAVAAK